MAESLFDALRRPRLVELIPADDAHAARTALAAHEAEGGESPAPIRALVGFGAWLAALLLVIFAIIAGVQEAAAGTLFGLIAIGVGAALRRNAGPGSVFRSQFALSLSLAGHGMVIGFVTVDGDALAGGIIATGLGLGGLFVVPDPVHRFASTLLAVGGLIIGLLITTEAPAVIAVGLALVAPIWVAVFWQETRWQTSKWADLQLPVGFGLSAAIAALAIPSFMPDFSDAAPVAGLTLTGLLAWVGLRIARERGYALGGRPTIAVGALLVGFAWIGLSAPGVVAAALGMVLAVERRHPVLLGGAIVFFIGFVAAWYHQMELTFFAKAAALAGGGLLFLLARLALRPGEGAR